MKSLIMPGIGSVAHASTRSIGSTSTLE